MKIAQQLVPITVLSVVAMMILPLPNWLLDILLCLNISFSIALLLSAATISQPERFTVLPSVILLTTLFRLGLNVSTTRQILGTGEAPEVVSAFGLFVVGGSIVVGLVVFLIITLIQFIVISKGAERVAEVAARFTLDAMPGKQMSIDADLRSGSLSLLEAKERRRELQRESRLYGSLDGAMKFIKGDAIAGLVITLLNMGAGILLGVGLHGLTLAESASRYTLYTVGDGLVSQLPALLVSIAAGLVVTRVAENNESSVGDELFSQIARESRVPALTAVFLIGLMFLPGLPTAALFGCVLLCLFVAVARKTLNRSVIGTPVRFTPQGIAALSFRISESALSRINGPELVVSVNQMRKEFYHQYGIIVPEPELELDNSSWKVEILFSDKVMVSIDENSESVSGLLLKKLRELVLERTLDLVNDTQTRLILEANESRCADLINSVVPAILSITELTQLFRALLAERLSVRDVPSILQGVLESDIEALTGVGKIQMILRSVRKKLRMSIGQIVATELGNKPALRLSEELEQLLLRIVESKSPLRPELALQIRERIFELSSKEEISVIIVPEQLRELILLLVGGLTSIRLVVSHVEIELERFCEVSLHDRLENQLKVAA